MNVITRSFTITLAAGAVAAAASPFLGVFIADTQIGLDNNSDQNAFIQPQDPALSGGGRDQSLQFGDVLLGDEGPDLLIGRLGTDILVGVAGNDVIVGGSEHFNPSNRDRAFGGLGDDVFCWSPGDGSDLFDGGPGLDTLVLGLLGEIVDGEVVFQVTTDQQAGDVFIDPITGLPTVDVTNSPGFCEVIGANTTADSFDELEALGLDNLVQFFIRGVADSFEAGEQDTDNGLRVTIHTKDVEFLVCASREGGQIEAFDLTVSPPRRVRFTDIPNPALTSLVK